VSKTVAFFPTMDVLAMKPRLKTGSRYDNNH